MNHLLASCSLIVAAGLAACGGISVDADDVPEVDATVAPDVDAAGQACDLTAPFGIPVEVTSADTPSNDWHATMTADMLTIVVSGDRPDQLNNNVYLQSRATVDQPFGAATEIAAASSPSTQDFASWISSDGLTLYTHSDGPTATYDNYLSVRPTLAAEFGTPSRLANVNSDANDTDAFLSASGALYFSSDRGGDHDLYVAAPGPGGQFASPVALGELDTADGEIRPVVTADELTIYFTRGSHIYVAHRSTTADGFGAPVPVTELVTGGLERPEWISPDGCSLLFVSTGGGGTGGADIFLATRPR